MKIRRDSVFISSVLFSIAFLSCIPPILGTALTGRPPEPCTRSQPRGGYPINRRSRRGFTRDSFHWPDRYVDGICQKGSLDLVRHVYHRVDLGVPAYDIATTSTPHSADFS